MGIDLSSLFSGMTATKQLAQYPDVNLYNAAKLLKPEERPTVPVRLYDDPDKLYREELQPSGGVPLSARAVGVTPRTGDRMFLKRPSMEYNDPVLLASKLAHEQVHVTQLRDNVQGKLELPAYEKEWDVISRFGSKVPDDYRQRFQTYLQSLRAQR